MDKLRERFEEAFWNKHCVEFPTISREEMFKANSDGGYWYQSLNAEFKGWQDCFKALQEPTRDMIKAGYKVGLVGMDTNGPQSVFKAMLNEFGGSDNE